MRKMNAEEKEEDEGISMHTATAYYFYAFMLPLPNEEHYTAYLLILRSLFV